ncbi:uncharacterized protein LOC133909476 [Phragmites australis]|uniref:uncharacterized protein LOC133909476 n=1 Tax=Phragmites australis TaxID=29695 RepID=UPI002D779D1D|nr:uncharacterized protein LOC133909476 [Phragmites australis]
MGARTNAKNAMSWDTRKLHVYTMGKSRRNAAPWEAVSNSTIVNTSSNVTSSSPRPVTRSPRNVTPSSPGPVTRSQTAMSPAKTPTKSLARPFKKLTPKKRKVRHL